MSLAPTQTFYSEIAPNRRQSVLLVIIIMAILGVLGLAIGYGADRQRGRAASLVMAGGIILAGLLSAGLVLRRRQPRPGRVAAPRRSTSRARRS